MAPVDCILPDALYLGGVWALVSNPNILAECKITHIVSILHEQSSTDPRHLTIALGDSHFENLLIHLPRVCDFIDEAVAGGGVVFVHLMRKNGLKLSQAIRFVREKRNVIRPNEGFMRQLYVFEECEYAPTETHPAYITWKKANEEAAVADAHAMFMHFMPIDYNSNSICIACGIPHNLEEADLRLRQHEITHIVAAAPSELIPQNIGEYLFHTVRMTDQKGDLLFSLPDSVRFIQGAIDSGGQVLVHANDPFTAAGIICAYLMSRRSMTFNQAVNHLTERIPWFAYKDDWRQQLLLYEHCDYQPTKGHPLVEEWIKKESPEDCFQSRLPLVCIPTL